MGYDIETTLEGAQARGLYMPQEFVLEGGPGLTTKLKHPVIFPETAIPGGEVVKKKYENLSVYYLIWSPEVRAEYFAHPETDPHKRVGFALMKGSRIENGVQVEVDYVVAVDAWLRSDRAIVYVTMVYPINAYLGIPDGAFWPMYFPNGYDDGGSNVQPALIIENDPVVNGLLADWDKNNEVPLDLTNHAVVGENRYGW